MLARRKTTSGRIALFVLIAAATALVATGDALAAAAPGPQIKVFEGTRPIAGRDYASSDQDLRVVVTKLEARQGGVVLLIDGQPYGQEKQADDQGAVEFSPVKCSAGTHTAQAKVSKKNLPAKASKTGLRSPQVTFHVVNRPRKPEVVALISNERRFMASKKTYRVDAPRFDVEVTVPDREPGDQVVAWCKTTGARLGEATLGSDPTARVQVDMGHRRECDVALQVWRGGVHGKPSPKIKVQVPKALPTAAVRKRPPASGAFSVLPRVETVPTQEEVASGTPRAEPLRSKGFTFDRPAHFPLPEFGRDGEPIDHLGLVIYEGMRFVVDRDGHYTVRFLASAPAMPVELRLQFFVADKDKSC